MQESAIKYVSAKNQADFLKKIIDKNMLSDDEMNIVINARNHKNNHKPKNTDILTYKHATALESLIGYLYYQNNNDRIEEIMNFILGR